MRSGFRGGSSPSTSGDKKLVRLQEPVGDPMDGFAFVPLSDRDWERVIGQFPPTQAYSGFIVKTPVSTLPDIRFPRFDFAAINKQTRSVLDTEVAKRKLVVPSDIKTRDDLVRWMIANPKLFGH